MRMPRESVWDAGAGVLVEVMGFGGHPLGIARWWHSRGSKGACSTMAWFMAHRKFLSGTARSILEHLWIECEDFDGPHRTWEAKVDTPHPGGIAEGSVPRLGGASTFLHSHGGLSWIATGIAIMAFDGPTAAGHRYCTLARAHVQCDGRSSISPTPPRARTRVGAIQFTQVGSKGSATAGVPHGPTRTAPSLSFPPANP